MTSIDEYIEQSFTGTVPVKGFTLAPLPEKDAPVPDFASEWGAIKKQVSSLVPGAVLSGQKPGLKEMLDALVLQGATWQELAGALVNAENRVADKLRGQLKTEGEAIQKSTQALLPVIARQLSLNERQSKAGPFNTDATIQSGSAATYNKPLAALRDDIHALNAKIGVALLALE